LSVTIAAVADTHLAAAGADIELPLDVVDSVLAECVGHLNDVVRPDVVLVLGDVVNDGRAADAPELLRRMRDVLAGLRAPTLVIPGNHDGDPDAFYHVFTRPPEYLDVAGVRFVPFVDEEEPECNAWRTPNALARMAAAAQGAGGPLVAVQHAPVFAPGDSDCPYNYTNADEVLAAMRRNGFVLAISGHYHDGMDMLQTGGVHSVAAPAFWRPPHPFLVITMDGGPPMAVRHGVGG